MNCNWTLITKFPKNKLHGFEFLGLFDYGMQGRWPALVRYNVDNTEFQKVGQGEDGRFVIEPVISDGEGSGKLVAYMELSALAV